MTKIITVSNRKGGVGKTTTAVHLAVGLARAGAAVLLIDMDAQGQCATMLGLATEPGVYNLLVSKLGTKHVIRATTRPNLHVVLGDQKTTIAERDLSLENRSTSFVKEKILAVAKDNYHYIIIDTSPGAGEMQTQALWAADAVLIPCTTDYLSTEGIFNIQEKLLNMQKNEQWSGDVLGILPTQFDTYTKESKATMQDWQKHFSNNLLPFQIHRATILRECAASGKTVFELDKGSRASKEYGQLVDWVYNHLS